MHRFFLVVTIAFLATTGFAGSIEDARAAYQNGQYDAALKIALPAAKGGDPVAQNIVGAAYSKGYGVEQSIETSIEWFKKSADQGFSKAMYNLGLAYRNDVNPPDYAQAITYFELAMHDDYPTAFTQRGEMFMLGQGSAPMPERARNLLTRAVELDDVDGIAILADLYRAGQGGDQDTEMALSLYSRAAAQGHGGAIGNLALMYELGMGVPKDSAIAYALYVEAVAQDDANSAINLASFMFEFDGYWNDPSMAYAYCLWGIKQSEGNVPDRYDQVCDWINSQLSEDERKAAKATFQSW